MTAEKLTFKKLKVTALMQTPIVLSEPFLPFDAIIYNQFVRGKLGIKNISTSRKSTVPDYLAGAMPIQKRNQNEDDWYYAASFAVFNDNDSVNEHNYAKRFDFKEAAKYVDFNGKSEKVETGKGRYKNYFVKEFAYSVEKVTWWCRADIDAINNILPFSTHIGKKSSQGCGAVLKWIVEETDQDFYKNDGNGNVMRAIPSNKGTLIYGIRPSYWLPKHQTKVIMPTIPNS